MGIVWLHASMTGLAPATLSEGAVVSLKCGCVVRIDSMKPEHTKRFIISKYLRVTLLSRTHPPTGVRCGIFTSKRLAPKQTESYQWLDPNEPCFEPPDALAAELGAKFG